MAVSQNCVWNVPRCSGRMERRGFVTGLVPDLWGLMKSRPRLYINVNIYIYTHICIMYVSSIHLQDMHVEATHASCRSFSLLICTTSLLYTWSTQVCLGWLVRVHQLGHNRQPASPTGQHVKNCHAGPASYSSNSKSRSKTLGLHKGDPGSGSGVVHGWSGSGTCMERGLERNGLLQHSTATQNWQFGARVAQQAILRLPAGSSRTHLYHQTAQLCHSGQQLYLMQAQTFTQSRQQL